MATVELPTLTDGTAHYSFRTRLDGEDYAFTFRFGERRQAWHFDMATLSGERLVTGQMVSPGKDLLKRVSTELKPPGTLYALNFSTASGQSVVDRPGLFDLGPGGRCLLLYTEGPDG